MHVAGGATGGEGKRITGLEQSCNDDFFGEGTVKNLLLRWVSCRESISYRCEGLVNARSMFIRDQQADLLSISMN